MKEVICDAFELKFHAAFRLMDEMIKNDRESLADQT